VSAPRARKGSFLHDVESFARFDSVRNNRRFPRNWALVQRVGMPAYVANDLSLRREVCANPAPATYVDTIQIRYQVCNYMSGRKRSRVASPGCVNLVREGGALWRESHYFTN